MTFGFSFREINEKLHLFSRSVCNFPMFRQRANNFILKHCEKTKKSNVRRQKQALFSCLNHQTLTDNSYLDRLDRLDLYYVTLCNLYTT